MTYTIPGLVISEVKPAKPYSIPLSRRVITEKYYGRNGLPNEEIRDPNHWLVKNVFSPNDTLYLINPITASVDSYSVSSVKMIHGGTYTSRFHSDRELSPMYVCLFDRKGYNDSVRIKLHEATRHLNKPITCYVTGVGERFICCSEKAMLITVAVHVIPKLTENRKTHRTQCSRKKWEAKKNHFKILESVRKKILKYLQENP